MTSNVAATLATTATTVPLDNNDTTTISRDQTGTRTELEPIAPSDADESSSKDTAVGELNNVSVETDTSVQPATMKKSFGFYPITMALALSSLLTSLEATITSTALPTIIASLGGAGLYVWIANGYYLTQYGKRPAPLPPPNFPFLFSQAHRTAFQPLFGQIADIYGRRWPMMTVQPFLL